MRQYDELIPIAEAFEKRYDDNRHWFPSPLKSAPVGVVATGTAALYNAMGVAAPESAQWTLSLITASHNPLVDGFRSLVGNAIHGKRSGISKPRVVNNIYDQSLAHRNFYHWDEQGVCHAIGIPYVHSNFEQVRFVVRRNVLMSVSLVSTAPSFAQYDMYGVIDTPNLFNIIVCANAALSNTRDMNLSDLIYIIKSYEVAIDIKTKRGSIVSFSPATAYALKALMSSGYSDLYNKVKEKVSLVHLRNVAMLVDPRSEVARVKNAAEEQRLNAIVRQKTLEDQLKRESEKISRLEQEAKTAQKALELEKTKTAEQSKKIADQKSELGKLNAKLEKTQTKLTNATKQNEGRVVKQFEVDSSEINEELARANKRLNAKVTELKRTLDARAEVQHGEIAALQARLKRVLKEQKDFPKPQPKEIAKPGELTPSTVEIEKNLDILLQEFNDVIKSIEEIEETPFNEFTIPSFGIKLIFVRLKELLSGSRENKPYQTEFVDDENYNKLKKSVFALETENPQLLDGLIKQFKIANMVDLSETKKSVMDEANLCLSVLCMHIDNINALEKDDHAHQFYYHSAKQLRQYLMSLKCPPYTQHEYEATVTKHILLLEEFYNSDFGKPLFRDGMEEKIAMLSSPDYSVMVLRVINMLKTDALTQNEPSLLEDVEKTQLELASLPAAEKEKHKMLTQNIADILCSSKIPYVDGIEGQDQIAKTLHQFKSILSRKLGEDGTPLTNDFYLGSLSCKTIFLPTDGKKYNAFHRRVRDVYATLKVFLAFAKHNPELISSEVVANANTVLSCYFNDDGTYNHEANKLIQAIINASEFLNAHKDIIKLQKDARPKNVLKDAFLAYKGIVANYSDDSIDVIMTCAELLVKDNLGNDAPSDERMCSFEMQMSHVMEPVSDAHQSLIRWSLPPRIESTHLFEQAMQFTHDFSARIKMVVDNLVIGSAVILDLDDTCELMCIQYGRLRKNYFSAGIEGKFNDDMKLAYIKFLENNKQLLGKEGADPARIHKGIHGIMQQMGGSFSSAKKAHFHGWFRTFLDQLPKDPSQPSDPSDCLRKIFKTLNKVRPTYFALPVTKMYFFIGCFANPQTGKFNEKCLIEQKILSTLTPLCDMDKQISVTDAIADFRKQNIMSLDGKMLEDQMVIRAVLLELVVAYQETNSNLTIKDHEHIKNVISELETTPKASLSSSQRRK